LYAVVIKVKGREPFQLFHEEIITLYNLTYLHHVVASFFYFPNISALDYFI